MERRPLWNNLRIGRPVIVLLSHEETSRSISRSLGARSHTQRTFESPEDGIRSAMYISWRLKVVVMHAALRRDFDATGRFPFINARRLSLNGGNAKQVI